jgi:hypothetical protein
MELGQATLEIRRMCDYIIEHGRECEGLFQQLGKRAICRSIRRSMDTGEHLHESIPSSGNMGMRSMAETLITFLTALPDSVIPIAQYKRAGKMYESEANAIKVAYSHISLTIDPGAVAASKCILSNVLTALHQKSTPVDTHRF